MTLPAFLYARFSSQEQGRGTSLVRQFENGRNYALSKGWLLDPDREISDKGRSAFHGANRSEGGALYAFERQVEKGFYRNGAVFIVEHFDRISREGWEQVHAFLKLCVENGVSVATIDSDRFYPAGARIDGGTIMELVFKSEGARDESKKKSDRGLDNWSRKIKAIEAGDKSAKIGMPPGWMDRDPKTNAPVLNPHRTAVLREIFDLYVDGYGLPSIVSRLNDRKEPSWAVGKKDKGNGWNTAYLHKLLTNRAVLGEYVPMSRTHSGINETGKGIVVPDHYPQAIPAELFDRVVSVRGLRRFGGGPAEAQVNNLFSGSAFCKCGAPMYFQGRQKAGRTTGHKSKLDGRKLSYVAGVDISYLRCNNNRRKHECANSKTFRYEMLEPAILDAVLAVAIDDKKFTVPDHVAALSANVSELERQIEGKRRNLAAIVDSLAEFFVKALAVKAAEIETELEADDAQLRAMQDELSRQRGSANPDEHLQRVLEVKNSINSEDKDARYSARVRVKQALAFLTRIVCDTDGIATVMLQNGMMAWRFDQKGNMIGDPVDLRNNLDVHKGLPGPNSLTADVLRRMPQPVRTPVDPSQQKWKYGG